MADPIVLVLAHGETPAAVRNTRGHLFEAFVARLLHAYGYNAPTTERLNVSADGIELDVVASHELSGQGAVAECKAYTSPVPASMLGTFHSKLVTHRFDAPNAQGFFVAIPRLTSSGHEYARKITAHDSGFHVLTAATIVGLLHTRRVIVDCPLEGLLSSDPAVVVTEDGVHAACLELDAATRKPVRVLVWAAQGAVPSAVLEAVTAAEYAQGCPAVDARGPAPAPHTPRTGTPPVIVAVTGSGSDFEYHLPAAPKFFVGRQRLVAQLGRALDDHAGVLVLNAKSGWGKSSAALRLQALTAQRKGHALIVDSRTATHKRFVTDALSLAARQAQKARVLTLPGDASWASPLSDSLG